jgi:hypothetical protein
MTSKYIINTVLFIANQLWYFIVCCFLTQEIEIIVRYHCGEWSEEVNSCILIISYMVYLEPKHSLGYYYVHIRQLLLSTYTTGIIQTLQAFIMYMNILQCNHRATPLLSAFPFPILFCSPFISLSLLGTLLAVIGSCPPHSQVARKLIFPFPPGVSQIQIYIH